jgi:hypothetical protein
VPVIFAGIGLMVSIAVLIQPVDVSVKLITGLPAVIVFTNPELDPIIAIPRLLLAHVPAPDELVRVVVLPAQSSCVPPIAAGSAVTVTVRVVIHPVFCVKVITAVPALKPDTIPVADPTVATAVLPELQVPAPVLARIVDEFSHNVADPVMADGSGFTVITFVVVAMPQLLDIV